MGADGRIFWEVDGLPGPITFSLCFDSPLLEGLHFLLLLLQLPLLLFSLALQVLDLSAEFVYFGELRFSTS